MEATIEGKIAAAMPVHLALFKGGLGVKVFSTGSNFPTVRIRFQSSKRFSFNICGMMVRFGL
jgi:hypothetical protein